MTVRKLIVMNGWMILASAETPRIEVQVTGDLDSVTGPDLVRNVEALMYESGDVVELDVGEVSFLDCSGLRALLEIREHVAERQAHFGIVAISRPVQRLLELTGCDGVFTTDIEREAGPSNGARLRAVG